MGCKQTARLFTRQSGGNGADDGYTIASGQGDEPVESRTLSEFSRMSVVVSLPHVVWTFLEQPIGQD